MRDPGLVVVWSGVTSTMHPFRVPPTGATLGRELLATRDAAGLDDRLSRQHARIAPVGGRFVVTDLGSRNGTFIHGDELRGTDGAVVPPSLIRTGRTLWAVVMDVGLYERGEVVREHMLARGPSTQVAYERALVAAHQHRNLVVVGEPGTGRATMAAYVAQLRHSALVTVRAGELVSARLPAGPCTVHLPDPERLSAVEQATIGAWLDVRPDLRVVLSSPPARPFRAVLSPALLEQLEGELATLAPARERPEEVAALVERTVAECAPGTEVHPTLVEDCLLRSWTANLRGVVDAVRRATVAAVGHGSAVVRREDLVVALA